MSSCTHVGKRKWTGGEGGGEGGRERERERERERDARFFDR